MAALSADEFSHKLAGFSANFDASGILANDGEDQAQSNLTVLVPEASVSVLIGAKGANVNQTKAATGCEISFCKKDEAVNGLRKCFHSGSVAGITKALHILCGFVEKNELSIIVATSAAGAVIGKGGAGLKNVREVTGCNTNFDKDALPSFAGRVLTMRYPEDGSHPTPLTKAVYMTLRAAGFESPTQNDCRKSMLGGGAGPQSFDMGPGYGAPAQNFGGYGPAPGNGAPKQRFNPYGAPPPAGAGGDGGDTCGIHGKRRGRQNLQPHPHNPRIMVCMENDACKGAAAVESAAHVCFTHGKRRGEQNLAPHPSAGGVFVCLEQDPCK